MEATSPYPTPAPVLLAPLVGRERERALALGLLRRPDVRLLTLTGPGGIGKTALALDLAATIAPEFADGVCFVPLAAVTNPELVAPAVARALGLAEAGETPLGERLAAALRHRALLLALDNFEHVLAAVPLVSDLLALCPRLSILVTSRSLLRVAGEYALPLPPLALPAPEEAAGEDPLHTAAVQLFRQRCLAVNPALDLQDAASARVMADICRRVDGVPLALELAAARVTHLSLPALRDRLERRLPLLTGGGRDRPLRLQTMRNAIAWSHDLLSPPEQTLFRRLAVFIDGCSLEAIEVMADDIAATPALDLTAALVEASLLRPEAGPGGEPRYRMLETIREFAEEQLQASGEAEAMQQRHAAYATLLAERYELAELLPDGAHARNALEADHANLRAALAWLAASGQPAALLRLAAALGRFWIGLGYLREGRAWLERALVEANAQADPDPALPGRRARCLVWLGLILVWQGLHQDAIDRLTAGLAACRACGDAIGATDALMALGVLATQQGDHDGGLALLEEAGAMTRRVDDARLAGILAGWVATNLAVSPRMRGDYALAEGRLAEAIRLQRAAGHTDGLILALGDAGNVARDQGDYAGALARYHDALALGQGRPGTSEVTEVIEAVGIVATAAGHHRHATRLLSAARAQRDRLGLGYVVPADQVAAERALAMARATLGEAGFAAAWAAGAALPPAQAAAEALRPLDAADPGSALSPREQEILTLIAAGMSNPAIAGALFLSVRTVENHVAHILAKLGVRTRAAAVAAAGLAAPAPSAPTPAP